MLPSDLKGLNVQHIQLDFKKKYWNTIPEVIAILIAIPPSGYTENFIEFLYTINPDVRLILLSSTSVYNYAGWGNEESGIKEDSPIVDVEKRIASTSTNYIILRLAGLIGPKRHPGMFFSGKTSVSCGKDPVNLLHQTDAVTVIDYLLSHHSLKNEIFNVCASQHPLKRDFYSKAMQHSGRTVISFKDEKCRDRIIDNQKIKEFASISFKFDNPFDVFLDNSAF